MKILFVGDASNLHNCLAQSLRVLGHEAVVASDGSRWMNTGRDINLLRQPGPTGTLRYLCRLLAALPKMRGFDVVEINGHVFLHLKPQKVKRVFDYLLRNNGMVLISALGTDYYYYRACHDGHTFRYSDYMVGSEPSPYALSRESQAKHDDNWQLPEHRELAEHITGRCNGIIACLWEYYATYQSVCPAARLAYGGIPIDTGSLKPRFIDSEPCKVRFFIGLQRERTILKGTDRLLAAAEKLRENYPDKVEITAVQNVPYSQYVEAMLSSHVILDQLYSYTPATNALLAMAQGLVAVSGAEPEYYDLIGERDCRPVINVSPLDGDDGIYRALEWIVLNKSRLPELSRQSREHVVKHNDSRLVAKRHIDFIERLSNRTA